MNVTRVRLDNGLTLLCEELHDAPVVAMQAWVNVGSADEEDALAGVAHLHEHMLFKGTQKRGVGEIARSVEAAGGEINAWTSFDQTVYHVVLAREELGLGLDVLADALRFSSFDPDELAREIEVVVEEIRRAEDAPSRRVSNAMFSLAYQKHPYRRPVLGSDTTVRAMGRDNIVGFYKRYYQPENITLVVAGDFKTEDLVERARGMFADWPKTSVKKPEREVEPQASKLQVRILREQVKEARIALGFGIPGLCHKDTVALDALSILLGHGESSRLFIETRRKKELVNDAYAYAYTPRDPGLLLLGAGLRSENCQDALTSLLDEAFKLREHLVTADELNKAKVILLSDSAYQRETVQGEARRLGFFEVVAGDWEYETRYRNDLEALTTHDLRDVARKYLTNTPCVVVQLPEDEASDLDEARIATLVGERFVQAEAHQRPKKSVEEDVTRITLPSGALLVLRPTNAPVVAARAVCFGGLRWEAAAQAGLGNLFASVWGLATQSLATDALAQKIASLGGSLGAFAGRNTLGMRCDFIAEKGLTGLSVFADALVSPVFEADDLARERSVILERIKNRDDNPAGLSFELFAEAIYPNHPYGLRQSGTLETVSGFELEDLLAYRRAYTTADKMVVTVTGGFDKERVVDLLSAALEEGQGAPLPKTVPPDGAPVARKIRHKLDKKQAHVIVGSVGTTVRDDDRFALEVLTTILSGQSGRLFLDLRDQQSLAYSVSASSLEGLDPGHILVHMGTSPDKVEQALRGLHGHMQRVREERVTDEEILRAQRYLVGVHAIDLQRSGARAMLMAMGERFGVGWADYMQYPERIRAVTAERVREVAAKYWAPERLIEVVVGP